MLTMHVPMLLALLGTVLMAIVIFAPAPVAATTTSFAPPIHPPLDHWQPPPFDASAALADESFDEPPSAAEPGWPALVDRSARACDAAARAALVEALGAVRTAWAEGILDRARAEEHDPLVLGALQALERRC